ncbi:folate receptor gamma-like [Littorina saxatilis]|uniref:Folate receptor-like domain-containing protein n=1 Tax=Littorina saxatilis TaxID=31220 RepID=A0AAN9B3L4_9CAEN
MDLLFALVELAAWLMLVKAYKYSIGRTVDEVMNNCMDGQNQKSKPGPESELFQHCSPWAKRSCCTSDTAQGVGFDRAWLNFDWNHCGALSPKCTQHFVKDLCFYECSPNVGPYLQPDVRKVRNNRYQNVPLCQATCSSWWEDCKMDTTCTDNWTQNFNWSTGQNKCPTDATCDTFKKVFKNATHFCENIWDHGFRVVPDTQDCFRLWFSDDENPNEAVARKEAARMLGVSGSSVKVVASCYVFVVMALFVFIALG